MDNQHYYWNSWFRYKQNTKEIKSFYKISKGNESSEKVLKKYGGKAIDLVIIFVDPQNRQKKNR